MLQVFEVHMAAAVDLQFLKVEGVENGPTVQKPQLPY